MLSTMYKVCPDSIQTALALNYKLAHTLRGMQKTPPVRAGCDYNRLRLQAAMAATSSKKLPEPWVVLIVIRIFSAIAM